MPQPSKIPLAFAASGDKNTIPESTETTGLASWQEGFPAITSTPFSEGGIAPKRADFNGIFNALSLATLWQQQGGVFTYDNTTDYEVGNVVEYSGDLYKCIVANGPNSAVKSPTQVAYWSQIMTAPDVASIYVPIAGGFDKAMTGNLWGGANGNWYISMASDSRILTIRAADAISKGAYLALFGQNHSSSPGDFDIVASANGTTKELIGKTDGTLSWDGNNIVSVETGSWTPVLKGGTTAGAFTGTLSGDYYKMNNLVFVRFGINATCNTQPIGAVTITGLPYTPSNDSGFYHGLTLTRAAGGNNQSMRRLCNIRFTSAGNVYFDIYQFNDGRNYTANFISDIDITNTSQALNVCIKATETCELSGCGWYECA